MAKWFLDSALYGGPSLQYLLLSQPNSVSRSCSLFVLSWELARFVLSLGLCVFDKGEELRSILSLVSSGCCDACYEQYIVQVGACAREKQISRACLQRNVPWIRHRFSLFAFLDSSVWLAFSVLLFWVAWNCVVDSLAN